jgi:hypothetical protein
LISRELFLLFFQCRIEQRLAARPLRAGIGPMLGNGWDAALAAGERSR